MAKGAKPVQFSITTLQPAWRQTEDGFVAAWEYCLPSRIWCWILALFGVWTICGHLTTCEEGWPIPGATVTAYDADWLQDDPLGSGTTDFSGHFLIYYTRDDFEKTPLTPWGINIEWVGGPDVYFKAELGGTTILQETQADGRVPGRENAGPCLCVELCSDEVVGRSGHGAALAAGRGVRHPSDARHVRRGVPRRGVRRHRVQAYVFGGAVTLKGNCPLKNIATGNPLEYRFRIGEWTWSPPGDDPATLPSVAPASLVPVTQIAPTHVGYVFYTDGNGMPQSEKVIVDATDDADGWIQLRGPAGDGGHVQPAGLDGGGQRRPVELPADVRPVRAQLAGHHGAPPGEDAGAAAEGRRRAKPPDGREGAGPPLQAAVRGAGQRHVSPRCRATRSTRSSSTTRP